MGLLPQAASAGLKLAVGRLTQDGCGGRWWLGGWPRPLVSSQATQVQSSVFTGALATPNTTRTLIHGENLEVITFVNLMTLALDLQCA